MKKFLAVYIGSPPAEGQAAPALSEEAIGKGLAAWGAWMADHAGDVLEAGGPLGKTKRVGPGGVSDVRNGLAGYTLVQAESHEAAAKMFEGHPHFTIFPGDGVEIMEVMPIPGQ